MDPQAPTTAAPACEGSIPIISAALSDPSIPVATVKLLPVVTAIFEFFAIVTPPSPTTDVCAPSPTILAPWSSAMRTVSMIFLYTISVGIDASSFGVSAQPTNQPSASGPAMDFTPVMCETSIGDLCLSAASTIGSGMSFTNGYLREISLFALRGCITNPNFSKTQSSVVSCQKTGGRAVSYSFPAASWLRSVIVGRHFISLSNAS